MKKLLLVSTILTAASVTANATSTAFDGFYAGVGAGFVNSKTKTDINESLKKWLDSLSFPQISNKKSNGLFLTLYANYGKNLNNFYFGGELSIGKDFTKRQINVLSGKHPTYPEISYEHKIKYKRGVIFGIAPKFGYVLNDNLFYIKPGFEISRDQVTVEVNDKNPLLNNNVSLSVSASKTNTVFTPSFGYERAYGRSIFRGEYTYNPGKKISINKNNIPYPGDDKFDNASYTDHRLMVGVAYKF